MRGFAQTVHCPRCGTAKPMGAEAVPIVTCTTCGLGFDPKPREQAPREVALVPVTQSLVHEESDDVAAQLVVRDSLVEGVWLLLVAFAAGFLSYLAIGVGSWLFIPLMLGLTLATLYTGASHFGGKTIIYITADTLAVNHRPLPRFPERMIAGDVAIASRRRARGMGRTIWVVDAAGNEHALVDAHDELAEELVELIEKHRARLGAPVRESD